MRALQAESRGSVGSKVGSAGPGIIGSVDGGSVGSVPAAVSQQFLSDSADALAPVDEPAPGTTSSAGGRQRNDCFVL